MDAKKLLHLLQSCIGTNSLKQGKLIHQRILIMGLQNNLSLCKNLIHLYFSFHLFESAKLVFQTIENPSDITLWNGLMASYTKNFMFNEALLLFESLLRLPHPKPDSYTYPSVLKACGGLGRVDFGILVHALLVKCGFLLDVVVSSSLVGMYGKCSVFYCAVQLFDEMPERDVACWNTVISCYYQDGQSEKALELFEQMKTSKFEPDSVTLTTAISSCARLLNLEKGVEIHMELVRNGFELDDFVSSALVDMYGKCGSLETAREIFEEIPKKSVVLWNSMISGHSLKGDSHSCIKLFRRMVEEGIKPTRTSLSSILQASSRSGKLWHGKLIHGFLIRNGIEPDIFVNSSLLELYFRCGKIELAEHVFARMPKIDVVSWNVMISGYAEGGRHFEALGVFSCMREVGVKPDAITFTSILPVCSKLAALEKGKEIHSYILERELESSEIVMGALLDMYAKCGSLGDALHIFNQLPERDLVSWTSMIAGYGSHGLAQEALGLFVEMQGSGIKPDGVAFLALMSACSHAGLVDEGCYYFDQMINHHGVKPTIGHYSCLVDLLGRAGRVHEAYRVLQNTPSIREDAELLSTLFFACHLHGEMELGEEVARSIIKNDPHSPGIYIVLANLYASLNRWDEVRKVRLKMKDLRLGKNPGCSWIEVDKRITPFFVEDKSHPHAETINDCLAILANHMEEDETSVI